MLVSFSVKTTVCRRISRIGNAFAVPVGEDNTCRRVLGQAIQQLLRRDTFRYPVRARSEAGPVPNWQVIICLESGVLLFELGFRAQIRDVF